LKYVKISKIIDEIIILYQELIFSRRL
jgi:hypothetical protein